jgi:glycosyltransferase involved in cell wall biosynthesis
MAGWNGKSSLGDQVTHLAIVLPGLTAGGTENIVSIIANHRVKIGNRVTILTLEPQAARPYYPLDEGIDVVNLGLPPQKGSAFMALYLVAKRVKAVRATLANIRPDVVVSFLTRTNIVTLLAMRGTSVPVIVSERNNPELQHFGAIWKRLRSILYPSAFGLVTMTQGAMNHFQPAVRRRSWVIPNPVHLPRGLQKKQEGHCIAAVGRLVPQKGFDLLIDAFALIAKDHPKWKLVIWGEGPDREMLERKRESYNLTDRIQMPGISETPGAWLGTSDVFVLSSRYEGWGIVLLEAMSFGLPCVSFDCDFGPSDMITDGIDGVLVPRENVSALAVQLSRLLGDQVYRSGLAREARVSAQRFSHASVMGAWDGVVSEALENRAAPLRVGDLA